MSSQRDLWKIEAILHRGGFLADGQYARCDYCKKHIGNQYHELIARSVTQGNPEARELSFQPELCSLLCQDCHELAETDVVREYLWAFNRKLWGKEFDLALEKLQAVMKTKLTTY